MARLTAKSLPGATSRTVVISEARPQNLVQQRNIIVSVGLRMAWLPVSAEMRVAGGNAAVG